MRLVHASPPGGPGEPSPEFWANNLELFAARVLEDAQGPEFMEHWIDRLKPRQVAMLRHLLGLPADAPPRERKAPLREQKEELARFVPAATFASRKSMHATLDVALDCLEDDDIAVAHNGDGSHDTTALMFAILDRSWPALEKVLHLDKLHKAGFARMRLPRPPRRPARRFKDFLASGELQGVLRRYDAEEGDRHTSELRDIIEVRDAEVVFIRRPHQESYVLADNQVVHGYMPDQIVLDFRDEAARLNIASHGVSASRDIANRIASAFYGQPCAYEDVEEETFPAQLLRFLQRLRDGEARDLTLVEMAITQSPLRGALDLTINNSDNKSIGPGLMELERALGRRIDDLDRIARFKVLFNDKRVAMKMEALEHRAADERMYVLRYRDQTLTLGERESFEQLIEHEHGIKIVSTEKRGTRSRRT
jgi:hypothetical protein